MTFVMLIIFDMLAVICGGGNKILDGLPCVRSCANYKQMKQIHGYFSQEDTEATLNISLKCAGTQKS